MPNYNGEIFSADGKGVTMPDDIQYVLGETANDIGSLCRSSKINMFSKHKPVDSPKLGIISDEDLKDLNYGIEIGMSTDPGSAARFEYIRPTSVFRLLDFDKYYHNAHKIIPNSSIGDFIIKNNGDNDVYTLGVNYGTASVDEQHELQISDFLGYSSRYLAIVWKDGWNVTGITASEPLSSENGYSITIPSGAIPQGKYDAIVVASERCTNEELVTAGMGLSTGTAWGTFMGLPFSTFVESSITLFSWGSLKLTFSVSLGTQMAPDESDGLIQMPEKITFYVASDSDTDKFFCTGNAGSDKITVSILEYKYSKNDAWNTVDCSSYGYDAEFVNNTLIATTTKTKILEDNNGSHLIPGDFFYVSKIAISGSPTYNIDLQSLRSIYPNGSVNAIFYSHDQGFDINGNRIISFY